MRALRQGLNGLLVALISIGLVVGGLSLSILEGPKQGVNLINFTTTPTAPFTIPATYTSTPANSPAPGQTQTATLTQTLTLVPTASPSPAPPTTCPAPSGWAPYTVQFGDSLDQLAQTYHSSVDAINHGNCLLAVNLLPGTILYLPPLPESATITPTRLTLDNGCQPPVGWVAYTIQHGDTLIGLSRLFNVTPAELQAANCMGSSTLLVHGLKLYVPFSITVAPPTATPIFISPTRTRTSAPSATGVNVITPFETSTILATITQEPAATFTPEAGSTATFLPPTDTLAATGESTQVPISTITLTVTPTP